MRKYVLVIAIIMLLLSITIPVYTYITYPSTNGSEYVLEEKIMPKLPFKPPRFIIGSMRYGLSKGVEVVSNVTVEKSNNEYNVSMPRVKPGLVLFMPWYIEYSSRRILDVEDLLSALRGKNVTIAIEALDTPRGRVYVVLAIDTGTERYIAMQHR